MVDSQERKQFMGQEIPEQKTDETLTSTSINPTAQQDGAPVPLRDDTQSEASSQPSEVSSSPAPDSPEASPSSRPIDVIPASAEQENGKREVTDVRLEKIRNGAPDGTRKNRCKKHDGSEALEHPGREALAQFLAAPRSLREFKSYSALANYFHMSRMTIYRWTLEVEVMQRAYFLSMRNEIVGDLEARRAWPEIMRKQVANAKGGDLDAARFCESHAWRPNPRVEQSHLSVSVSTMDLFGTSESDGAEELQDDDRQSQGGDR